jgi:hypothetical protein
MFIVQLPERIVIAPVGIETLLGSRILMLLGYFLTEFSTISALKDTFNKLGSDFRNPCHCSDDGS